MEFGLVQLGDARRTHRLVQVAGALATCPSGALPQALPDWAQLKGAYRLFSNRSVSYEKILAPHFQRTHQQCTEAGEYLLIEDSSELDYSNHRRCRGLGQIGNQYGRGLWLHSNLAARIEAWDLDHCPELTVIGLAGQQCWARTGPSRRQQKERWRQRLKRPRESQRWSEALEQMPERPESVSWTYIADRESDIYEVFERCQRRRAHFIVRAQFARALAEQDQSVFAAVSQAPVIGVMEVQLRAREGRAARVAQVEIRALAVSLRGVWRPGGERPTLKVNVVEAREVNAPADVAEPLHWVLLTSWPVERLVQARRVVNSYAKRWLIEEYHKALKTGAQVEQSELAEASRIQSLIGVLALVALRLLNTKLLARSRAEERVDEKAFGPEAIRILNARFGRPKEGWTHASLLVAIARLGGFLARRGDGSPGWLTIWRGWNRLMTMVDGILCLSEEHPAMEAKRCG